MGPGTAATNSSRQHPNAHGSATPSPPATLLVCARYPPGLPSQLSILLVKLTGALELASRAEDTEWENGVASSLYTFPYELGVAFPAGFSAPVYGASRRAFVRSATLITQTL
jgi:hypothetical protein